jgi:hypothetical protein
MICLFGTVWGSNGSLDMLGYEEMKSPTSGSLQKFVGPEPSMGVSRHNIRNEIKRWVDNQHLAMRRRLVVLGDRLEN